MPNQKYTEPYIPVNENCGVVKFTASINELSINLDLGSFHLKSKKKGKRFCLPHGGKRTIAKEFPAQRPGEALRLDSLKRRQSLRCVRKCVNHSEPIWLRLNEVARYDFIR